MDDAIKKALAAAPVSPTGEPIAWRHPLLVFLAENGRIPPSETEEAKGKLIFLPEPPKPVFLEFFAYQTIQCVRPGT